MNPVNRLAGVVGCLLLASGAQTPARLVVPVTARLPSAAALAHGPEAAMRAARSAGLVAAAAFVQKSPRDGAPATAATQVFLGRTARALIVIWICPVTAHSLRAHFGPRDQINPDSIYNDDFVEITVDPAHDRRHGFAFAANPLGIETDALWTEATGVRDVSWDTRWTARGWIGSGGYVVEMEIPFAGLGVRGTAAGVWGVTLERYQARIDEQDFWPRVSSRIAGLLSQEAILDAVTHKIPRSATESGVPLPLGGGFGLPGGLEITPYLYGRSFHLADAAGVPGTPVYRNADVDLRAGADVRWMLSRGFVFDATLNPDFSQLASDQPQFTLNQPFAVAYPEKRPFFLENANLFDSPASGLGLSQLVFTRDIGDPTAGAKFSGKGGGWEMAAMAADDRSPGESVAAGDPEFGRHAQFAVVRAVRDLGDLSSLGFQYTGRELPGAFNRVGAVDARFRLGDNFSTVVRAAASFTNCSNGSALCLAGPSEFSLRTPFGNRSGGLAEVSLNGRGRRFYLTAQYQDISPSFHTDVGYIPRTDLRNLYGYYHFYFRPEGRHLVNWGIETNLQRIWDHSGRGISYQVNAAAFAGFRGNTKLFLPILTTYSDTVRPQDFAGLTRPRKFIHNAAGFDFRTAPVSWGSFNLVAYYQGAINEVVPAGTPPRLGIENTVDATLTLRLRRQWQVSTHYLLDRLTDAAAGALVYRNDIVRPELQMFLTPRLGLRLIPQYNRLTANSVYSSLAPGRNFNLDLLVSYILHPGTELYLGLNSDLQDPAPGWVGRSPARLRNDGRQVFLKVSYQIGH